LEDEPTLYRITEANWIIFEQFIVARALHRLNRTRDAILLSKLQTMLSGADTDEEDKNPLARNTQFELYVGATLAMGGVQTRLAEPDLRIYYCGKEIGIAAKRVRSVKQLIKRAKDAVNQIKASGLPGIVALNVDVLLRKTGTGDLGTEQLAERLAALTEVDQMLSKYEEVFTSLIIARDAVWQFGGRKPSWGMAIWHRFHLYPRTAEQCEPGEKFWRAVMKRINARIKTL
jgi:hypothetical protein